MRKGVSYIIALVLIAAALFFLYSSGPRFTGYAVFEQSGEEGFNISGAVYENVIHDINGSLVLDVNQTQGTYTSKIYDANETGELGENDSVAWNNLTWQGTDVTFEMRNCDSSDCANISFTSADLNALNLSGQYFQYKAFFDSNVSNETVLLESVAIDYSLLAYEPETEPFSVTIDEPSGTKDIDSGIPIEFTITGGENLSLSCWYNLKYASDDAIAIVNTTLSDCNSSSLNVPNEGDYVLNLYVNNSEGFFHDDSSFSVSLPTETEETSETEEEETSSEEGSSVQIPLVPSFELIAAELSTVSLASGGSQEDIPWSISNTGRSSVSACSVKPVGDYASWVVAPADALNINSGDSAEFVFNVNVPADAEVGTYLLSVSIECAETAVSKDFSVEVSGISEEAGEGAPVGGFAIFAGVGAGEAIIFFVVLFVLVFIFVFARRMRKKGKTLKDIFSRFKRPQQQG